MHRRKASFNISLSLKEMAMSFFHGLDSLLFEQRKCGDQSNFYRYPFQQICHCVTEERKLAARKSIVNYGVVSLTQMDSTHRLSKSCPLGKTGYK